MPSLDNEQTAYPAGTPVSVEITPRGQRIINAQTEQTAYDAAIEYARTLGTENGRAAASWYFDGNTGDETYRRVLAGLDAGDPAILDTLPAPDLSGEWADTLTGPQLVEDAIDAAVGGTGVSHIGHAPGGLDCEYTEWASGLCDAYETAFSDAAQSDIEATARRMIGGAS